MGVRYREGLAIHPDPESCAGVRKDMGEALIGADASRVLSESAGEDRHGCGGESPPWMWW